MGVRRMHVGCVDMRAACCLCVVLRSPDMWNDERMDAHTAHTAHTAPEPTFGTGAYRTWWIAGRMIANMTDGMGEHAAWHAACSTYRRTVAPRPGQRRRFG